MNNKAWWNTKEFDIVFYFCLMMIWFISMVMVAIIAATSHTIVPASNFTVIIPLEFLDGIGFSFYAYKFWKAYHS